MLKKAIVYFTRPDRTYAPGELLSGYVLLWVHSDKVVKRFYGEISGRARTRILHGRERYTGEEVFHQQQIYFAPCEYDKRITELRKGFHQCYFDFILPTNLPDTADRPLGKVSYRIEFIIDRPRPRVYKIHCDVIIKRTVGGILPPPSKVLLPLFINFIGGQIIGTMVVPSSIYRIGTEIVVKITVRNYSNVEIVKLICSLVQKSHYSATLPGPVTQCLRTVLSVRNFEYRILPGGYKAIKARLPIPNNLQNLTQCLLINDKHAVELGMDLLGHRFRINHEIPVEMIR